MRTLAAIIVLFLATPLYAQRETIEGTISSIAPSPVKYGQTLTVKGTVQGAVTFKNGNKLFLRVLVYQGGTAIKDVVYEQEQFIKQAGAYSLSYVLTQQNLGATWDSTKPATGVVTLIHYRRRGNQITITNIGGPVQISIGAK
jgi:hypothetical protein